MTQINKI